MPKDSGHILCIHCNREVSLRTERRHRTLSLAPTPSSTQTHPKKARVAPQNAFSRPNPPREHKAGVSSQQALAYLRALLAKQRQRSFPTEESDENELDNDTWNPHGIDFDTLSEKGGDPTVAWLDLNGQTAKEVLRFDFEKSSANIRLKPLSTEDRLLVDAFNYRMYTNIPSNATALLPFAFQDKRLSDLPSLYQIQLRTAALSGVVPVLFDRCYNSCVSYTGDLKNLSTCPYCSTPRFKPNGTPTAKPFSYIPIIPRLKAAMANKQMRKLMTYREQHQRSRKEGQYTDVFDGSHYQALLSQSVPGARTKDRHFFDDVRDIALALSTDGFCPFKKRKLTCWPILICNLNLPPDIRFQLDNIICLGVIPGPKAVKDIETFLYPLVEELFELMHGVAAYDVEQDEMFILCAFLILAFGDIPAISKLMSMKGHNGKVPCQACEIIAIRAPDSISKKVMSYVEI